MDLSKKAAVSPQENWEIATTLQFLLISELFARKEWKAPAAVFHGGTALSMLYQTGRRSEDLDFMIDETLSRDLEKTMKSTAKRLQVLARGIYPDCTIDLIGPKGHDVDSWFFGWSHPNRHGKVKVKVEFYTRPQDLLKNYLTAQIIPTGPTHLPAKISNVISGPQLISAWSDKIIAMSQRPAFKWRDIYDLWFLTKHMKSLDDSKDPKEHVPYPTHEKFVEALESTASIYGKNLTDIRDGLQRMLETGVLESTDLYADDMKKWFQQDTWDRWNPATFDLHRTKVRGEVLSALSMLNEHIPSGPTP